MEQKTSMHHCPICYSIIKDIRRTLIASYRNDDGTPAAGQFFYEATCPSCEIKLFKRNYKQQDSGWLTSLIPKAMVSDEISETQFELIESKLSRYKTTFKRWLEFKGMKRPADKICLYVDEETTQKGLVIIRGEWVIGRFPLSIEI